VPLDGQRSDGQLQDGRLLADADADAGTDAGTGDGDTGREPRSVRSSRVG
jgi:hypothetical protein